MKEYNEYVKTELCINGDYSEDRLIEHDKKNNKTNVYYVDENRCLHFIKEIEDEIPKIHKGNIIIENTNMFVEYADEDK
jgi:hypothetical protein